MDRQANSMYDPMWGRSMRSRNRQGNKAVIAAKFEDCSQKFTRLSASLAQHLPEAERKELEDCLGDFIAWGTDTGANDQSLDYKLRKAKGLHESVVELLKQLQDGLDIGSQFLEENTDFHDSDDDRQLDDVAVYEEGMDSEAIAPESSVPKEKNAEVREAASDLREAIAEVVDNLKFLSPSLRRPFPHDVEEYASSVSNSIDGESITGDRVDIELARQFFPYASKVLHMRLGRANWMRKLSQRAVQEENKQLEKTTRRKGAKLGKRTARQEVAQDAFNFQRPTIRAAPAKAPKPFLPLMSIASSEAPSDTASDIHSVFDKSVHGAKLSRAESATTMATLSSMGFKVMAGRVAYSANPLPVSPPQFPKIPIQLDSLTEGSREQFTCNLCGYDLEAGSKIKTEADWKQHVLGDLEPYLCTFDECFSAQEMYAIRDEWYQHELEAHRIKKVWVCPACSLEFDTRALAEQHLPECQDGDDDDSLKMLRVVLRQSLSGAALDDQVCLLCHDKLRPVDTKDHISRHLEMFALLSIQTDESSEEDESDELFSQTNDDVMSEHGRKEAVLENFVKEQLKLNIERGKAPPDRFMEGGGEDAVELLDDMSDYDGSKDSASRIGGRHAEAKNDLMSKMLGEHDNGTGVMATRSSRRPFTQPGPASLASSTEKLPILQTRSFPKNEDFMGREKDLANLYKILSEPGRVSVVSGEGGMGKTALAVEFTYRYEHSYHYIFWIQAETPVGSCDTFCQIALQLGLVADGADNDTMITAGREYLESVKDKRWLMVFDNVDKWDDIDIYTPGKTSATNGSILITTRHESLTAPSRPTNYFRIALKELDMDEGRKLLIHGLPPEVRPQELSLRNPDFKIAGEIAALAGLPLLIVYISGYVRQSGTTLSEFWDYWNEWRPNVRNAGGTPEATDPKDRDSVFHIALGDLAADARKVLEIMAFLDSDGIQKSLLVRNDGQGPMHLRPNRFRTIIPNLINQRFVQESRTKHEEHEIYHVHRVLQARLLQDLNAKPKKRDEAFRTAFELVRIHLPRPSLDYPDQSKWSVVKEYLPHVLSLQRAYADPLSITTPTPFHDLAELFKDGGVILWQRYLHNDALKLLNSAEKILDDIGSEDEDLRAEINVTINLLLQYFGISHRKESKDRLARILAYRERKLARKQPGLVTREEEEQLNNARADYANALLQFNNYSEAEVIYQACYDKCRELAAGSGSGDGSGSGIMEPGLAFSMAKLNHHLAYCKMYRREWSEAVLLAQRAVAMIERIGDRQLTMRYQFDLACIILQSGEKDRALALHRDIMQARIGLQGRASYFSLQSQYAYAVLCHLVGRLDEAEMWMRAALDRSSEQRSKNFWPEAAVARTKYQLSQVLREKHGGVMTAEADRLAVEAKDVLSRMLPYDPEPIVGVTEEDTLALFDHLQPVFGGRFTSLALLKYVGAPEISWL